MPFPAPNGFNDMQAFVYGEFSAPVTFTHSQAEEKERLSATANTAGKTLEFRYGISFISVEQARKNLREEITSWNFEKTKANARAAWEKALGQIQVEGGTPIRSGFLYGALPLLRAHGEHLRGRAILQCFRP